MKKSGFAAVALVGATALTGSAVLPGSAATAAPTMHTKKIVLRSLTGHPSGGLTNVGTDALGTREHPNLGFDSYSGITRAKTNKHVVWGAFALRGGMIMTRLTQDKDGVHGVILTGAGKYLGIVGTATDRPRANGTELVTLRYHF